LQDLRLFVALDVFLQSLGDSGFFAFEVAEFDDFSDEVIVEC
jgi:hypothetical protein